MIDDGIVSCKAINMGRLFYIVLASVSLQIGCSSSDSDSLSSSASEYGLTEKPYTSLQQVWVPKEPSPEVRAMMDDGTFTVYQHPAVRRKRSWRQIGKRPALDRAFGIGA